MRCLEGGNDGAAGHGLCGLHDLLLGGFYGDSETELGGVLQKEEQLVFETARDL